MSTKITSETLAKKLIAPIDISVFTESDEEYYMVTGMLFCCLDTLYYKNVPHKLTRPKELSYNAKTVIEYKNILLNLFTNLSNQIPTGSKIDRLISLSTSYTPNTIFSENIEAFLWGYTGAINNSVVECIKQLRESQGLTQAEFAKKYKSSQQQIAGYENGKHLPSLITLKRFFDC